MDEHTTRNVEPNPSLNMTKTAKEKRQEVSSSFDNVTMKDAAPSVDNVSQSSE